MTASTERAGTSLAKVELSDWFRQFPVGTVGGSLYAVPQRRRAEAAVLLHRNGCRIHVDVIIGRSGHQGVTWPELAEIRAALPLARIDLHLIVLDTIAIEEEATAVDVARRLSLETLTMTGEQVLRQAPQVDRLRATGTTVWEEIAPDVDGVTAGDHVDGALIMLITPGTKELADLGQLDKITRLADEFPVGVDGGVTHLIGRQCHNRGAGYLISGRDLLTTASTTISPTPADAQSPERRPV